MFVFKRNIAVNLHMLPCFGISIKAAVDIYELFVIVA